MTIDRIEVTGREDGKVQRPVEVQFSDGTALGRFLTEVAKGVASGQLSGDFQVKPLDGNGAFVVRSVSDQRTIAELADFARQDPIRGVVWEG